MLSRTRVCQSSAFSLCPPSLCALIQRSAWRDCLESHRKGYSPKFGRLGDAPMWPWCHGSRLANFDENREEEVAHG